MVSQYEDGQSMHIDIFHLSTKALYFYLPTRAMQNFIAMLDKRMGKTYLSTDLASRASTAHRLAVQAYFSSDFGPAGQ